MWPPGRSQTSGYHVRWVIGDRAAHGRRGGGLPQTPPPPTDDGEPDPNEEPPPPASSWRDRAVQRIDRAIERIEDSDRLRPRQKQRITRALERVQRRLDRGSSGCAPFC